MKLYPYLARIRVACKRGTDLPHLPIVLFPARNLSSWDVKILSSKHQDENNMSINVVVLGTKLLQKEGKPCTVILLYSIFLLWTGHRASTPHRTRPFFLIVFLLTLFKLYFLTASDLKSSIDFM